MLAAIVFIVFMERSQRRLVVQYPEAPGRQPHVHGRELVLAVEDQHRRRHSADLRLVAAAAADTIVSFAGMGANTPEWVNDAAGLYRLRPARPHDRSTRCGIIFFCFFYTSIVFNPEETADNLRKYGGFLPGIRPGKRTAEYLDYVLTRLTVIGAAYITVVCLLPEILIAYYNVPFYLGGTSILIVISVTMDTVAQIQSHLGGPPI